MKILMLSSGSDTRIFQKGSAVRERMLRFASLATELHIIVATGSGFSNFQEKNLFVYPTNSKRKIFYARDSIRIARGIKYVDLVTAQDPFETGFAGFVIAHRARAPLELQIHTDPFSPFFAEESLKNSIRLFIASFLIPRAAHLRVVSERVRHELLARGIREEKISVIPVVSSFTPVARNPIPFRILTLGRLTREKNQSLALHVFAELSKEFPKARLEIVGSGPEEGALYWLARELGILERVIFTPWTRNTAAHYAQASVVLLTSNYEGYGLVLKEAARASVPIVSTDVGMVGFELPRHALGVAPPGDEKGLYEKIRNVFLLTEEGPQKALAAYGAVKMFKSEEELLAVQQKSWEGTISEYRASTKNL